MEFLGCEPPPEAAPGALFDPVLDNSHVFNLVLPLSSPLNASVVSSAPVIKRGRDRRVFSLPSSL